MLSNNFNYYPTTQQPQYLRTPQMPTNVMPQNIALKGRPVSSFDEVKASSVDFDGSISFFPDLAHDYIYTKQIGADGNPVMMAYLKQKEIPVPQPSGTVDVSQFVTREELNQTIEEFKKVLTSLKKEPDTEFKF